MMRPSPAARRPWWLILSLTLLAGAAAAQTAPTPIAPAPAIPGAAPPAPVAARPAPRAVAPKSVEAGAAIEVETDHATLIKLGGAATTVFVANPDIADIQVPNATSFLVLGKKVGRTTAYAILGNGRTISYAITVGRGSEGLTETLRQEVPGADIRVTGAPNGIIISGEVASPAEAHKLATAAKQYVGPKEEVTMNVTVREAVQVNLRVRVAEVTRDAGKQFGINWSAIYNNGSIAFGLLTGRPPVAGFGNFLPSPAVPTPNSLGFGFRSSGGSVNVSSLIDALASEGLVTVLAEPNLTAISGETASFLAGGEFPIPVSQGNQQLSIEFKKFGVSVDFTPIVLDHNRISVKVRPEVSELSDSGAIQINGITIPALAVRRAETTVDLGSGESFAIAGLFQNNVNSQVSRTPWLGDVPVLGPLFRSDKFQRHESELVIIVTPYIVHPAKSPSDLHLPTDGLVMASDLERLLLGRLTAKTAEPLPVNLPDSPHLRGDAGFILE
jgi:pilus assembly protein CpaC